MFYTRNSLAANAQGAAHMQAHWNHLWAHRNFSVNADNALMAQAVAAGLMTNASGITKDYWQAFDTQVLEMRNQETGMEIVNDLLTVQTVLPIGKTVKFYNQSGNIADDVIISIDGQAPYSFDHTDFDGDADPIPIIQAGFGVNWRHFQGMQSIGIDLALESQRAKQREYNKKLVGLILDGADNINVEGYQSQGLRNHRNTKKINLGAGGGGANIDLTTATAAQLIAFFQGPFASVLNTNFIDQLSILWVSPEIDANLSKIYVENGVTIGTVKDYLMKFIRVGEIRRTFAFSGNEFAGYVRDRDVITPLVGMPTGVMALPRPMPEMNYNFRIMGAMGLQVKVDGDGLGGVVYGAVLVP